MAPLLLLVPLSGFGTLLQAKLQSDTHPLVVSRIRTHTQGIQTLSRGLLEGALYLSFPTIRKGPTIISIYHCTALQAKSRVPERGVTERTSADKRRKRTANKSLKRKRGVKQLPQRPRAKDRSSGKTTSRHFFVSLQRTTATT